MVEELENLVVQAITAKSYNSDSTQAEAKIDALVYELYCSTQEEIALIEGR